jgi:hypothetical protein
VSTPRPSSSCPRAARSRPPDRPRLAVMAVLRLLWPAGSYGSAVRPA